MPAYVQVWRPDGPAVVMLDADRITVGKASSNEVPIASDRSVSRMHAVFERFPAGWCIRDLNSRNGTFVNGERIIGERPLRSGDEIRVGKTRITYRFDDAGTEYTATEMGLQAPDLTRREREVLLALCSPVLSGDLFTEPASIRQIAQGLFVTDAAVKQHLVNLYDKFAIYDDGSGARRIRLANEAIRRGAVSVADLKAKPPGEA
jgi:DNA-binding CsgD family transcriptional regulator